jgi:hypothetical protein
MTMRRMLNLLLWACAPAAIGAQEFSPLTLGIDFSALSLTRSIATTQRLTGPALGAKASIAFRRFELEGRYTEAALTPDALSATGPEDYVDARIIARVRVIPGLSLGAGPHLRAFITPSGTARWSRLELHARFEGELIAGVAQLRVDTWYAASAESNVQGGGTGAVGGEAGMLIRIPRTPTSLYLGYAADRATFVNEGSEFVDGIRIALVLDRILAAGSGTR